ncbi:MAG: putative hydrolase [Bacillales bacterium]|jgi:hypothetical protein|nr:putative hydrolase [Bacillales bacterium]
MTYQEQTWNFFKTKNLPDKSIASIMGNIQAESGFDPDIVEGGSGIGFGLCQWSFGRRTQLEAYGIDIQSQLEFLWSELSGENLSITGANFQWINKTGYLNHDEFMSGNGTIEDLTSAFCFCWERPDIETAHLEFRQISANNYFIQFNGTGGGQYVKLIYPFWFGSNIKISYLENRFIILNEHGNVVRIKNELTNRTYYVNKSSIKII